MNFLVFNCIRFLWDNKGGSRHPKKKPLDTALHDIEDTATSPPGAGVYVLLLTVYAEVGLLRCVHSAFCKQRAPHPALLSTSESDSRFPPPLLSLSSDSHLAPTLLFTPFGHAPPLSRTRTLPRPRSVPLNAKLSQ